MTVFDAKYAKLSGTHRIQRVPKNEKSGRRHSSTIIVSVLDVHKTVLNISPENVRCDTYRASGNGGQHRNKTDSAVRLTYLPTGMMVTATEDRSQHVNRKVAWERLERKLLEEIQETDHENLNEIRRSFIGQSRSFSWTEWRDEVKSNDGARCSMKKALSGKLNNLIK